MILAVLQLRDAQRDRLGAFAPTTTLDSQCYNFVDYGVFR
jgi:hypothetical protein